jgi:hypothetical protein
MARKTKTVQIEGEGRDQGKVFFLTELPSSQIEEWASRALFAMMNCGVEVPDDLLKAGLAGLMAIGIKSLSKVPYEMAKPLLDEIMSCVAIIPDPRQPAVKRGYMGVGPMIEDDIEEVSTRLILKKSVFDLHMDFFTGAARSKQEAAAEAPKT